MDMDSMETRTISGSECGFSYRSSFFKKSRNLMILSACIELEKSEKEKVAERVQKTIAKRAGKDLQVAKSAGSYFMNPKVDDPELIEEFEKEKGEKVKNGMLPAGWLIDQVGLRGKKIGGAEVGMEHANYIINSGKAKSDEVVILASFIKQQVRDKMGVQLQEEINYIGF